MSDELAEQQRASIGAHVRRARRARTNDQGRPWTTQDLADAAGVSQGTVISVENGRKVRPGNLKAIIDTLELVMPSEVAEEPSGDAAIDFAKDLVAKWLGAIPEGKRDAAVRELMRYLVSLPTFGPHPERDHPADPVHS